MRGCSPDGASRGRDGADEAPEVRLRNVDLQWRDLRVEWPQGGCWGLLLMVQGRELDLDGRAGEAEGASAKGGQWLVKHKGTGHRAEVPPPTAQEQQEPSHPGTQTWAYSGVNCTRL